MDLDALEALLVRTPASLDVRSWSVAHAHIWPLVVTSIVGLALQCRTGYRRGLMRVGGPIWRAGVIADYHGAMPCLARLPQAKADREPTARGRKVLLVASRVHGRHMGETFVLPLLDVAVIELRRAGWSTEGWIADSPAGDPALARAMHAPLLGRADLLAAAHRRAHRTATRAELRRLPGFDGLVGAVSEFIGLSPQFLTTWLARQVDLMLAATAGYGETFARDGYPAAVVLLASGYWWSAGLALAARRRNIVVVEIEHGAERPSAMTAASQPIHFSCFNTLPEALITWSTTPSPDQRVLAAGPIANRLPALVAGGGPDAGPGCDVLRVLFEAQSGALAATAGSVRREILVSSDVGVSGAWIADLLDRLPGNIFCWIRRHPGEPDGALADIPRRHPGRCDVDLASQSALPLLLDRVDLHVTRFSALTLEAADMGVPTLATDPYAGTLFSSRMPSGMLTIVTDPADAARRIEAAVADPRRPPHPPADGRTGAIASFIADRVAARQAATAASVRPDLGTARGRSD